MLIWGLRKQKQRIKNRILIKILCVRFAFLCSLLITCGVYGQIQPTPSKSLCLSVNQHLQIKNEIQRNIRDLEAAGILNASKRSTSTTSFSWPLRQVKHANYPDYYVIANFVDHDASNALLDYNGGQRTYNGHMGTDIGVWPFSWIKMQNGEIEVIAAASGTIVNKFDGNSDLNCDFDDWNAVYVQHPDGSIAWYGHLKKNSLTTKSIGQSVSKGDFLGQMGSSGNSTEPHLHFEVYDQFNNLIDPFGGPSNTLNAASWWADQKPYSDPAIMRLMTGESTPIPSNGCPSNLDLPNEKTTFDPGETIYFSSFLRGEEIGMETVNKVYQPNGQLWKQWTRSSSSPYSESYWYETYDLPGNAMLGQWRYEVTFNGSVQELSFLVGSCQQHLGLIATHSSGTQHIGSSSSLTSTQQVLGGTLNLHSGNLVQIQYPFSVENGAVLTIETNGCGPY